jgi:hypothetical protein
MQAETLRKSQISFGYISPELKPIGTEHYLLHSIGHNDFKVDDEGNPIEKVYVLMGVMNPSTHNYLGSAIIEIHWNNPIWKAYDLKKIQFMDNVRGGQFAKQDMNILAQKCYLNPKSHFAKTKYDWMVIIQETHPSLTTEEMKMLYATIKMLDRKEKGQENDMSFNNHDDEDEQE